MINSIDDNPVNHGGAFHFRDGKVVEKIPFDKIAQFFKDNLK